jgi:hypothetical protein
VFVITNEQWLNCSAVDATMPKPAPGAMVRNTEQGPNMFKAELVYSCPAAGRAAIEIAFATAHQLKVMFPVDVRGTA